MQISEEEIKRNCSAAIYKRGLEYFREGRVHLRLRDKDAIGAIVDGEELYNVRITFSEDHIHDMICTCPYYQTMGVACKHIVATLKMRQAELSDCASDGFQSENERLAAELCRQFDFSMLETQACNLGLTMRISHNSRHECCYSAVIRLGHLRLEPIKGVESFLEAYIRQKEFKISRHKSIYPHCYQFSPAQAEVLQILAEAYENKSSGMLYYTPKLTETDFGVHTAKRLFDLLSQIPCEFVIDGMSIPEVTIVEDNPDILVDVTATDESINLSLTENGIALIPDGSWFFYENTIFHTDAEWRSWFMPIYRTVVEAQRTQIDFVGNSRMEFATKILPSLQNRHGVILQGIEDVIIRENAQFDVFFDRRGSGICAVIFVHYGGISLKLPYREQYSEKILIRDTEKEAQVLSYFSEFQENHEEFTLDTDEEIYRFLTEALPGLSKLCTLHTSTGFEEMRIGKKPSISGNVSYRMDVDLLEVSFETEFSKEELIEILQSIHLQKSFYRYRDGNFLDLEQEIPVISLLRRLDWTEEELLTGHKELSKQQTLYMMGLTKMGLLSADENFHNLCKSLSDFQAEIAPEFSEVLRPYQKVGVHWMQQLSFLGLGGILADDMGLGKTLQVIAFVMSEQKEKPALVIAPSALVYNWLQEIHRFSPRARVLVIEGPAEERERLLKEVPGNDFVLTSYALLRRDIAHYQEMDFSACFIDEAQYIKNPRTMNSIAVKKIRADRRFALTGTPIENTLGELWSIFDFVMPGYLYQQRRFVQEYENPMVRKDDKEAAEDLKRRVHPFILRRMKQEVLTELPEKIETTVLASFEPEQEKLYQAFLAAARNELEEIIAAGTENHLRILALLMRLRQICCHPKLIDEDYQKGSGKMQLLEELLVSARESGHRVLVFSQFTSMLTILKKRFEQLGMNTFYLDGSTPGYERVALAERFNQGEGDIFLISLKAGGTGLNLTGADMVIHYDPWWNPAVTDQASDRAYRIGQTKAVQIIRLAVRNSIEEQILKLSEKKRFLANQIISENTALLTKLSTEELLELFR